jgi:hypothetical protein
MVILKGPVSMPAFLCLEVFAEDVMQANKSMLWQTMSIRVFAF